MKSQNIHHIATRPTFTNLTKTFNLVKYALARLFNIMLELFLFIDLFFAGHKNFQMINSAFFVNNSRMFSSASTCNICVISFFVLFH